MTTIVAEIAASHAGSIENAKKLIAAAAMAGANWAKIQTFHPDRLVLDRSYTLETGPWAGQNLHDLYAKAMTPWEWHKELFDYALKMGIGLFSSPFSPEDVALLETLECPMYKIASFEIIDLELIEAVARTEKPVIISTGMANDSEIHNACVTAKRWGATHVTILECVSQYPANSKDYDLKRVIHLAEDCGVDWGISDHTRSNVLPVIASAAGASVIERHIHSPFFESPDSCFASDYQQFMGMVDAVRETEAILSTNKQTPVQHTDLRRSLYFDMDVKAGERLHGYQIRSCRPAMGIRADRIAFIEGQTLKIDGKQGTPITWDHLGGE